MLRVSLLVVLLAYSIRAHVTDKPNVFDRLYRKIEKLNPISQELAPSPTDKLYEKLDKLNSLDSEDEEDEELLDAMQGWLSAEQMDRVVKDLQRMKLEKESDQEYGDGDWTDEDSYLAEGDYPMDGQDDWDGEELPETSSTSRPLLLGVVPSAMSKLEPVKKEVSAAASIAATNARPRIIDNPNISALERQSLISAVLRSMRDLVRAGKCLVPTPRWLTVRQLAPAADTVYIPPCVQLHRCAPDSGCCLNEGEQCAPIEGEHVTFPFYLHKADSSMNVVRMQFYNHTKCGCVSRDALQSTIASRMALGMGVGNPSYSDIQEEEGTSRRAAERQNNWRVPTTEPPLEKEEEEATAPPQLRRCTCPALFLASMTDNVPCSCVCEWPDFARRRDCQSLARGKEHFGLRDRVCVARGDCTAPSCEYGVYDRNFGRCPLRRYRRIRYHGRGRYQEKTFTV